MTEESPELAKTSFAHRLAQLRVFVDHVKLGLSQLLTTEANHSEDTEYVHTRSRTERCNEAN